MLPTPCWSGQIFRNGCGQIFRNHQQQLKKARTNPQPGLLTQLLNLFKVPPKARRMLSPLVVALAVASAAYALVMTSVGLTKVLFDKQSFDAQCVGTAYFSQEVRLPHGTPGVCTEVSFRRSFTQPSGSTPSLHFSGAWLGYQTMRPAFHGNLWGPPPSGQYLTTGCQLFGG